MRAASQSDGDSLGLKKKCEKCFSRPFLVFGEVFEMFRHNATFSQATRFATICQVNMQVSLFSWLRTEHFNFVILNIFY